MNDNKWKINLTMAGDSFPVWIQRENEEIVRKAAAAVDERINQYRVKWPEVPREKVYVIVAYQFALEALRQQDRNDTDPYTEKIKDLTEELENYIRSEK